MNSARALAIRIPRNIWRWIRQVSGDAAYENYLCSTQRVARAGVARADARTMQARRCPTHATSAQLLSRSEFYLDQLRRRYSTVSRCC
jgi:Selenoprotein, putative